MADGLQITPGTGPTIDTDELLVDGEPRHRQRVQIAGDNGAALAQVLSVQPGDSAPGLVTRLVGALPAGGNMLGAVRVQLPTEIWPTFLGGLGRVSNPGGLNASATNARLLLTNPAGSGRTVSVRELGVMATTTLYVTPLFNPTSNLPTAVRPVEAAQRGWNPSAVAGLRADLGGALGGGIDPGALWGIPGGSRQHIELPPLDIPPGQSLGLNVSVPTSTDVTVNLVWVEV